jgi:hypothetical protein
MSLGKQQISPLQIYSSRDFTGLVESNHLANAYLTAPDKVGSILSYAHGYKAGDNVLSLLTGGLKNTQTINGREYTWDLHSQTERVINVLEDSPDAVSGTPGYGNTRFRIVMEEKWFDINDNIVADDQVQYHIVEEPYQDGLGWVYTCVHNNPDPTYFVDIAMISKGARFSKDYTTVEEYSDKGGGVAFSTPFKLKNQISTLRKTYNVTRNAHNAVMVIELQDAQGNKTKMWSKLTEWTAMGEWYREQDRSMIYSVYNKNAQGEVSLKGQNARPIFHGAGIRQQIAASNIRFYTKMTYNLLDDFLLDLSYNATQWGGDTHFVALTGKMGMREFDRAIREYAKGNNITVTNSGTFINGSGSELVLTGYFKTVEFMNGIKLTVKEFAPYDDVIRNRQLHPVTKKPLESYRFTILNFGRKDGVSNIRKIVSKDSEMAYWHVAGSTDPYSGVAKSLNQSRATGKDGYDVHFLAEFGVQVQDPTSCGELIMMAE